MTGWLGLWGMVPMAAFAYESAFEPTRVGMIEIKTLPAATALVASGQGRYFERSDGLFMKLFRYIDANDVKMTVPVQAEIEPGAMWFYVGSKDAGKDLQDTGGVRVVEIPERVVASIGARGGYSEKNFTEARNKLDAWIGTQESYATAGDAYAIYWNGPYVPGFMKRFEVHVPVREVSTADPAE